MFGAEHQRPHRAYADFVRAGLAEPPASPFSGAVRGLLLGSQAFVDRIRDLLRGRSEAEDMPERKRLRSRPSLDRILGEVARYFDCKQECWSAKGTRTRNAMTLNTAASFGIGRGNYARNGRWTRRLLRSDDQ